MIDALSEYAVSWSSYYLAAFGLLLVSWRILKFIGWRYLRHLILLAAAAILLTPAINAEGYWSPSWVIAGFALLNDGAEAMLPVGRIIGQLTVISWIIYTVIYLIFLRKKSPAESMVNDDAESANSTNQKIPRRV